MILSVKDLQGLHKTICKLLATEAINHVSYLPLSFIHKNKFLVLVKFSESDLLFFIINKIIIIFDFSQHPQ